MRPLEEIEADIGQSVTDGPGINDTYKMMAAHKRIADDVPELVEAVRTRDTRVAELEAVLTRLISADAMEDAYPKVDWAVAEHCDAWNNAKDVLNGARVLLTDQTATTEGP